MAIKCFSCANEAAYVSTTVSPAGYFVFQCRAHAIDEKPGALWGSDPGWIIRYRLISTLSEKEKESIDKCALRILKRSIFSPIT